MSEFKQGKILPVDISDEISKSYLTYAMTVIVGRALPDVRDGLKPAHRRILYAMSQMGLAPNKSYQKSARTVGEVLGKYHPHGDIVVYDTMVRMAQDFNIRYPLVDGHGNFGSIDGDSAAAMRYTEARLEHITLELLRDLDKETVDFKPNFDEQLKEPVVLPARYPNLLVNGSSGIAVGMATNIPPHNLGEVIDGCVALIDNPDLTIEELIEVIPGPDFPTGGFIMGRDEIHKAYRTGRGVLKVRAKTRIEQMRNGKSRIVVTELPYNVNKARMIEKIAHIVRDKKVEGITDLRDESDRDGIRVVIELRRDVDPNVVLNRLYKNSQLQESFGIIMLALINNEPKVMNLKKMLGHYVDHQKEVVRRRTKYLLKKAEDRAHILEGYRIALDNIDEVIKLIKASKTVEVAKNGLITNFGLSEIQAKAILEMRLQRLTGLERDKIEEEYKSLLKEIARLQSILNNELLLLQIIKDELLAVRDKFADDRRTEIIAAEGEIDVIDLIADEDVVVTITHKGYIKRQSLSEYSSQRRGGRGRTGFKSKDKDFVEQLFISTTHHQLLVFSNRGIMYRVPIYQIPESGRHSRGVLIQNITALKRGEKIMATMPIKSFDDYKYLLTSTRKGFVKRTLCTEYESMRLGGLIAVNLQDDDELIGVKLTNGENDILIGTYHGKVIRFPESQIRPMGRATRGVSGIMLSGDDAVVEMDVITANSAVLSVTANGYGKRTDSSEFRQQNRYGKGVILMKTNEITGHVVGFKVIEDGNDVMMITESGIIIRVAVDEIPSYGRNTRGVRLQNLETDDKIVAIARIAINESKK
ncbi:DNA gyrase subunit A [Clostridium sp. 'deep sea']|uniref:DNA gyrase subunit A n=1 Tax=Clostridium sp. 'deep sea' TaxID=2779445 RepID=UPI0018965E5C|nr:DNA gyrase subunit A [Clostridium sp. 'deep sea']QOR34098.1 DNA gyrase subunit A [Clostridium sp. 'deep sea']